MSDTRRLAQLGAPVRLVDADIPRLLPFRPPETRAIGHAVTALLDFVEAVGWKPGDPIPEAKILTVWENVESILKSASKDAMWTVSQVTATMPTAWLAGWGKQSNARRSVQRALDQLVRDGIIQCNQKAGEHGENIYHLRGETYD
jgi:hypothetical protein